MTMSSILNFTETPLIDESLQSYQVHEYETTGRTNLDTEGEIRINIELQELYSHPSESYLLIEGQLTKANEGAYADADNVAITNNGIMHLFSQIS